MPDATVHITLAPQARMDLSVDGQNAVDTAYDDNGTGSISGTLEQTGATVEIQIDNTSFTVPDGPWTMTFS